MGLDDDFQRLTDGEEKERDQEVTCDCGEENTPTDIPEELEFNEGDAEKKAGAGWNLVSANVGGAAQKKFVQVLLSPRKRMATKQSVRKGGKGGGSKQVEANGPSNPKPFSKSK